MRNPNFLSEAEKQARLKAHFKLTEALGYDDVKILYQLGDNTSAKAEVEKQLQLLEQIVREDAAILKRLTDSALPAVDADHDVAMGKIAKEAAAKFTSRPISAQAEAEVFAEATREAVKGHLAAGRPVPVWRNDKVEYLDELLDDVAEENKHTEFGVEEK